MARIFGLVLAMMGAILTTAAAEEVWLPIVVHADGAEGSRWRSTVVLLSVCERPVELRLTAHHSATDRPYLEATLAPRSQLELEDAVEFLVGEDGAFPVAVQADGPLGVSARIFSVGDDGASVGQSMDGVRRDQALGTGEVALLPGLAENPGRRTNIGLSNMGPGPARVAVDLYLGGGGWLGGWEEELAPHSTVQEYRPFATRFGREDIGRGWAEVTVLAGEAVTVYASLVDNLSNDPTTVRPLWATGCTSTCPPPSDSQPGPLFDHRVRLATSVDGDFFTDVGMILEHASVPDAVVRDDGEVWLYAVNGKPGQHGIWVAREGADGRWRFTDCVRIDGVFEGDAVDPDVRLGADGRYRLTYYLGHFVTPPVAGAAAPMYTAVSDDGLHFTVEALSYEHPTLATDPTVVRVADDRWLMAIAVAPSEVEDHHTLILESTDGLEFTPTGAELPPGIPELVVLDDGRVRLFTSGFDGLVSHVSVDGGATWQLEEGVRLPPTPGSIIADPSVIRLPDGTWQLYVKQAPAQPPAGGWR